MMEQKQIFLGKYQFDPANVLGKGATGYVYRGTNKVDNSDVAIKAINIAQNSNQITRALLETQKRALKALQKHSNVLRLCDIIECGQFCFIITQIYNGGTLKDYIGNKGKLNEDQAITIFKQILSGYCAIAQAYIIHRDMKPANVMLTQNNNPVIIDFGFCQIIQVRTVMKAFNVGSPSYMAPQAYQNTLYSQKSDIWSLGIILYQMLTGETLDYGLQTKTFFSCLNQSFIAHKLNQISGVCRQVLEQVLRVKSDQRISCHKIKYILDKDAITKLNISKNSVNASRIQNIQTWNKNATTSCSIQPNNHIKRENNKTQFATFQSLPLDYSKSSFSQNKIYFSRVDVSRNQPHTNLKLKESRYRGAFTSLPQISQNHQEQAKFHFPVEDQSQSQNQNAITNLHIKDGLGNLQNNKILLSNITMRQLNQDHLTIKPLIFKQKKAKNFSLDSMNDKQNLTNSINAMNSQHFSNDHLPDQSGNYLHGQRGNFSKPQTPNGNKFSCKNYFNTENKFFVRPNMQAKNIANLAGSFSKDAFNPAYYGEAVQNKNYQAEYKVYTNNFQPLNYYPQGYSGLKNMSLSTGNFQQRTIKFF